MSGIKDLVRGKQLVSVILKLMGYCVKLKVVIFICLFPGFVHTREIKNHRVYGKREIQVEKFSIGVMSNEQLKTILMDRIGVNLPIFVSL